MDQQGEPDLPDNPAGADGADDPFTGKWVAVIHGRVAAVGDTPEQARLLAQRNWPKDEAVVLRIPAGGLRTTDQEPI